MYSDGYDSIRIAQPHLQSLLTTKTRNLVESLFKMDRIRWLQLLRI